MRKSSGLSLIELIVAISLASFVLVGVAVIVAQMARSQVEGIRSGTVTGWSVASYSAMAKEIEDASVLAYPTVITPTADQIVICKNWSRLMGALPGAPLNPAIDVAVIQYCVDTTDAANLRMWRYANIGPLVICPNPPAAPVLPCTATPPGTWNENGIGNGIGIVGFRLERLGVLPVFLRDDGIGGVRLRYVIGRQTPRAGEPTPKNTLFNFGIAMQKAYANSFD